MENKRTSHDFLVDKDLQASRVEIGFMRPAELVVGVRNYSDAELYRIIVAKSLREGRFTSKAEFDNAARNLGTLQEADEQLAFLKLRPGCDAWRRGSLMVCECGVSWKIDASNPPNCNRT